MINNDDTKIYIRISSLLDASFLGFYTWILTCRHDCDLISDQKFFKKLNTSEVKSLMESERRRCDL